MPWKECGLNQQQRLQQVPFSHGISYSQKTGYRTPTTCLFFSPYGVTWKTKLIW
jgi:hypothetical protein